MRTILTIVALASLALAASCGADNPGGRDTGDLTVVASFYPLAEAARRVGGDEVTVVDLTPAGVEPHDVELTPDDIEEIATADVVLYAGGGFQPAVEDAVAEAEGVVVDVTEGLTTLDAPEEDHAHEEEHEDEDAEEHDEAAADPHVWLDPMRYADMVRRVADALDEADPAAETPFADNARAFETELQELDVAFRAGLADCQSRLLVVNHAAFGYLADAYELRQEAISGLSPESEPDPERLAELRDLVRAEGVTTVFVESLVSPEAGAALAEEAGVSTAVLDPIEGLAPERLAAGEDYLSVMLANLGVLRDGLDCG
jgi:zinc transport system substrate-binding protein